MFCQIGCYCPPGTYLLGEQCVSRQQCETAQSNKKYILNKVMFDHYHVNFPFKVDYCFITIVFKHHKYDFEQQLNEMDRLMHSFPFCFIAGIELRT